MRCDDIWREVFGRDRLKYDGRWSMKFRIKSNECQDEFYVQYRRWWWPFWLTDKEYFGFVGSVPLFDVNYFATLVEARARIAQLKMVGEPDHVAYVSN